MESGRKRWKAPFSHTTVHSAVSVQKLVPARNAVVSRSCKSFIYNRLRLSSAFLSRPVSLPVVFILIDLPSGHLRLHQVFTLIRGSFRCFQMYIRRRRLSHSAHLRIAAVILATPKFPNQPRPTALLPTGSKKGVPLGTPFRRFSYI